MDPQHILKGLSTLINTDQLKYHRLVQTEISRVETYCKIYIKN